MTVSRGEMTKVHYPGNKNPPLLRGGFIRGFVTHPRIIKRD